MTIDGTSDDLWLPALDVDRHHGEVRSADGQALWVVPRLHLSAGWYVEIRRGSSDGELVSRRWTGNSELATTSVEEVRRRIGHMTQAAALTGAAIDPVRSDIGVLVLHVPKWTRLPPEVRCDGDEPVATCRVIWTELGSHDIDWVAASGRTFGSVTTIVEVGIAIHLYPRWPPRVRRDQPVTKSAVPLWHRCKARSLTMNGGGLRGPGDLRTLSRHAPL